MDDMAVIESMMRENSARCDSGNDLPSPPAISAEASVEVAESPEGADESISLAAPAVLKAAKAAMEQAEGRVNNPKIIDKHAKKLEVIAHDMIENQLETERLKNDQKAADNKVARKKIENDLYEAKQKGVRLRKEAKHQSEMQKARHKAEKKNAYWETHKETLEQYGMKEGSNIVACTILLFLDGIKCFFLGLAKVSDALVKAIKWILIIGVIVGVLMAIPVTRTWILTLLGFV